MPPKSNNQKKKEAEAAGRPPKKTKQQENAGKSASQKKAEMQVRQLCLWPLLMPTCRLSVPPTRRRSLVDGNLNLDLCHQDLQCGCSIDFVKPFLPGWKFPYPGRKTYFQRTFLSGICNALGLAYVLYVQDQNDLNNKRMKNMTWSILFLFNLAIG